MSRRDMTTPTYRPAVVVGFVATSVGAGGSDMPEINQPSGRDCIPIAAVPK
jgi:hypothetical protein